jgi:adenylate cyclase
MPATGYTEGHVASSLNGSGASMTDDRDLERHEDNRDARSILLGTNKFMRAGRQFFLRLPSGPRCKLCASPFSNIGGVAMRAIGKGPWPNNPNICSMCWKDMVRHKGGAEVECSLLFADVRGSTTLAEGMRPAEFRSVMSRFFVAATDVLVAHEAIVDKFVGDEVIGIFVPGLAGPDHSGQAIGAGRELLRVAADELDLPIGAGAHTGVAYVGTVGDGSMVDFTAMGDAVNVTARLASAAGPYELLVSSAASSASGLDASGLEHRRLDLKGKTEAVDVLVLQPASPAVAAS